MAFLDLVRIADRAAVKHLGGQPVVYTPTVGAPPPAAVTVDGIFDENYLIVEEADSGVEQRGPAVFVRLEELPSDPATDDPTITVAGVEYEVWNRKPDSLGGILLLLHRVG